MLSSKMGTENNWTEYGARTFFREDEEPTRTYNWCSPSFI